MEYLLVGGSVGVAGRGGRSCRSGGEGEGVHRRGSRSGAPTSQSRGSCQPRVCEVLTDVVRSRGGFEENASKEKLGKLRVTAGGSGPWTGSRCKRARRYNLVSKKSFCRHVLSEWTLKARGGRTWVPWLCVQAPQRPPARLPAAPVGADMWWFW